MWFLIACLYALCMRLLWRAWRWHKENLPYTPKEFYVDMAGLSIATIMFAGVYWLGKLMLLY